jgi:hypothetical protein
MVSAPIDVFLDGGVEPNIQWLPRPKNGKILADPFPVILNGRLWIFCEEYDLGLCRGRIVYIEVLENSNPSEPRVAIELPYHVSYPYMFDHDGDVYCVPETRQAREIALYKAEEFPHKWRKVHTLVADFSGVDGTVFKHDGCWWLTSSTGGKYNALELHIWHASSPLGPWTSHAANPVKRDSASSRPAGTPFVHEGHLYRPSQDCSETYGRAIVLNQVVRLTPTEFEEIEAAVIMPSPKSGYPDGVHTLSAAGDLTLIDGKRISISTEAFRRRLLGRLGHRGGATLPERQKRKTSGSIRPALPEN